MAGIRLPEAAYAPLDVIGLNDYFGWFDAGGGATDDRDALSPFLDSFRACYPTQALLVSEFGFDGSRDGPVEVRGTYAFQANTVAFHLGVFATKPWLSGAIYWMLQDLVAWPGWDGDDPSGTPPFEQKGPGRLQRQPQAGVRGRAANLPLDRAGGERKLGRVTDGACGERPVPPAGERLSYRAWI